MCLTRTLIKYAIKIKIIKSSIRNTIKFPLTVIKPSHDIIRVSSTKRNTLIRVTVFITKRNTLKQVKIEFIKFRKNS